MVRAMTDKPANPRQSHNRAATAYTGELARPIRLPWSSDDLANLCVTSTTERLKKLELLAAHYGVDLKKPEAMLVLVWKLAEEHVPGFRIEYTDVPVAVSNESSRGRPKSKTGQYNVGLLIARELASQKYGERGHAARLAQELAKIEIEEAAKRKGRRPNSYSQKKAIAALKRQIENDLSRLNKPELRKLIQIGLDGIKRGDHPSKIEADCKKFAGSFSHKKSEAD